MNEHALKVLDFETTLGHIAGRAAGELGREAVLGLRPMADLSRVQAELERVGEVMRFRGASPDWAPLAPPDARRPLQLLEKEGAVLDPAGLLLSARLLHATAELRSVLGSDRLEEIKGGAGDDPPDQRIPVSGDATSNASSAAAPSTRTEEESFPHLARLRDRLPHHPDLQVRVDEIVDSDGEIQDGASSELRRIRGRLRGARSRVVQTLEKYLRGLPERIQVPDASISIRDGRYVIPIRREGKSSVGGIIHGESSTGATLFVEPPLALRLMNEVQELEREEAREVQRILREITGRLRRVAHELAEGLDALVDFDCLWARARTARAWDGHLPQVVRPEEGTLRIIQGRHPLLVEQNAREGGDPVVPFDLELEPDERALVVSGPNTGGKTVFLKSLGLLHLLMQSGVVPPVGPGTRLLLLDDVFADIGDEQSIAESLSTFSAHLANAIEILDGAGPGSLVLMDEMGTGTDPSEGAALARAILETLVERGALALVTSHLGALKRLDSEGSGIVNASLLFDSRRIAPTYQLQKGRPGRSYGLAIARRLGVPDPVLTRAEGYVDSGELEVERLLATLEEKERELSSALAEARKARARAAELEAEAQERESLLSRREDSAEARAREEARRLLLEARKEVEEAIQEVREKGSRLEGEEREELERKARARVEKAARKQRKRMPETSPASPRSGSIPAPGARVRVVGSGARGTVQEAQADRVTVEVSGMRLQLPPDQVEEIQGEEPERKPASRGGWTGPQVEASHEADLRGLRVDEVELELGRALDGAIMANLHELRIIHGKGTGAVKARVQELLKLDGRVGEFRPGGPGEGGGGVTVAILR